MTNVLLTSAGRRNYLVNMFRTTLAGQGKVFAADVSGDASALQEADQAFIVPLSSSPNYIEVILSICRKYDVKLLIPLNDLELPVFAHHRELFLQEGIIPLVSSPGVVDICFDKWGTFNFMKQFGLSPPKTFLTLTDAQSALKSGNLSFPLVVKPRWGSASIGIDYPEEIEELEMAYKLTKFRLMKTSLGSISSTDPDRCLLIQERLQGQEFGLDIINDLSGKYVKTFIKRKLSMRAGETDRAVTVECEMLNIIGKRIGESLGHIGNLDCDVFLVDESYYLLEMNPRFGGGYPFSHAAGANLPATLIAWAQDKTPDPDWLEIKSNVASAKCDRLVKINNIF